MPYLARRNATAPPSRAPIKQVAARVARPARLLSFARRVFPLAVAQLIGRLGSLILAAYTGRVLGAAAHAPPPSAGQIFLAPSNTVTMICSYQ
jgi:hypothetical protein